MDVLHWAERRPKWVAHKSIKYPHLGYARIRRAPVVTPHARGIQADGTVRLPVWRESSQMASSGWEGTRSDRAYTAGAVPRGGFRLPYGYQSCHISRIWCGQAPCATGPLAHSRGDATRPCPAGWCGRGASGHGPVSPQDKKGALLRDGTARAYGTARSYRLATFAWCELTRIYFTITAPSGRLSSRSLAIKVLLPGSVGLSGHSGTYAT